LCVAVVNAAFLLQQARVMAWLEFVVLVLRRAKRKRHDHHTSISFPKIKLRLKAKYTGSMPLSL
jgi:hypothetical protein